MGKIAVFTTVIIEQIGTVNKSMQLMTNLYVTYILMLMLLIHKD
jgi:hypothetical protein